MPGTFTKQTGMVSRRRALLTLSTAAVGLLTACGGSVTSVATSASGGVTVSAATGSSTASSALTRATGLTSTAVSATTSQLTSTPVAKAATSAGGRVVEIRWQNRNDANAIKLFQAAVLQDFTPAHPDIKITIEPLTGGNRDQKLLTQMAAGDAPDVFETWRGNVEQYAQKDLLLDVTPLVAQSKLDVSDFYPWQWRNFQLNVYGSAGQGTKVIRFGLPKYVNVMFLWVNKDLFQEKGLALPTLAWNQNDYANAMEKLTTRQGETLTVAGAWILYMDSLGREWARIAAWGGQIVDPNDRTKCLLDQTPAMDALEWGRHLIWDTKTLVVNKADLPQVGGGDAFWAGKVAMREDGFYPFTNAVSNAKTKINWTYAHVPMGPVQRKVEGTSDGFAMWKGSTHSPQAWEVLQYLSGPSFQTTQAEATGLLPVRTSVLAKWKSICIQKYPELEQVNLDIAPQAMQMGYPQDQPEFFDAADAANMINTGLQALYDKPGTPTSSFRTIAQQVTSLEQSKAAGK